MANYQPKLPLEVDSDGKFIKISNSTANVKQKLRMIILTSPGEKLMNPDFGVGIKRFLFEFEKINPVYEINNQNVDSIELEDLEEKIKNLIINQCSTYLPDADIIDVKTKFDQSVMFLQIDYSVNDYFNDSLELTIAWE